MEERKQKEIEYYEKRAEEWLKESSGEKWRGDFEGFDPGNLAGFRFCYQWLKEKCPGKIILDYGCGNGIHSVFLAKYGARVIGIDLSEKSLKIARQRAKKEGVEDKIEFLKMDCEKMEFPDDYFDIIFDGGTFSSIDLNKAYPELQRVLKPSGFLLGIETFGHNPFTNLKRRLNKIRRFRTEWAVEHILKDKDLSLARKYFDKVEVKYFHIISWMVFPFLGFPGAKIKLKILEQMDKILAGVPGVRRWAFKVVFTFSQPKKTTELP